MTKEPVQGFAELAMGDIECIAISLGSGTALSTDRPGYLPSVRNH